MKTYYLLLVVLLIGCAPQKRLNRLLKKHPDLSIVDSVEFTKIVIERDTAIFDSLGLVAYIDALQFLNQGLQVENEDIKVRLDYLQADTSKTELVSPRLLPDARQNDQVRLKVEVRERQVIQSDTIEVLVQMPCDTVTAEIKNFAWWEVALKWWGLVALAITLVGVVFLVKK